MVLDATWRARCYASAPRGEEERERDVCCPLVAEAFLHSDTPRPSLDSGFLRAVGDQALTARIDLPKDWARISLNTPSTVISQAYACEVRLGVMVSLNSDWSGRFHLSVTIDQCLLPTSP
jgi:hypothetical protein